MYDQEKVNDFYLRMEDITRGLSIDESFKIISAEIDNCEDKYLYDYIGPLNFLRYEKVLDWIESNTHRMVNIGDNWGQLAASSLFSWVRADKWLSKGRPLSLIALDALILCTTIDQRLNQSLWIRQINPKLNDNPGPEIIANRLRKYLEIDNVPRTQNSVRKIINNVYSA